MFDALAPTLFQITQRGESLSTLAYPIQNYTYLQPEHELETDVHFKNLPLALFLLICAQKSFATVFVQMLPQSVLLYRFRSLNIESSDLAFENGYFDCTSISIKVVTNHAYNVLGFLVCARSSAWKSAIFLN